MAMRFMNGLTGIINALKTPTALKVMVETLGFQHLDLDVTVPRVAIFRDAIVDLFDMELGTRFNSRMRVGLSAIMNYVGGAIIYIRGSEFPTPMDFHCVAMVFPWLFSWFLMDFPWFFDAFERVEVGNMPGGSVS